MAMQLLLHRAGRAVLVVMPVLALGGWAGVARWRTRNIGPVQRGWVAASTRGCLACHGAAGPQVDPSRELGGAPPFEHDEVTGYSHDEGEIREWILDGEPKRVRDEQGNEPPPVLKMPAWQGRLSPREVGDLVAWIKATSDFDPVPDAIAAARSVAARLGCFGCHGPQGRGETPNPGSLKGYIPSWSGADLPDLARDDAELREWIRDGSPRRLRENPAAAFFMRRQLVKMPAFRGKVSEDEVRQIIGYIRWLRRPPASAAPATKR
jgi:mono/diheme cytochrome c family protein